MTRLIVRIVLATGLIFWGDLNRSGSRLFLVLVAIFVGAIIILLSPGSLMLRLFLGFSATGAILTFTPILNNDIKYAP